MNSPPSRSTPIEPEPTSPSTAIGIGVACCGAMLLIALAVNVQSFAWAFILGLPFSIGLVFGQLTPFAPLARNVIATLVLIGIAGGAMTMELAGLLCGVIAAAVFIVPTLLGAAVGAWLRNRGQASALRRLASSLVVLSVCGACLSVEGATQQRYAEETITTTRVLEMDEHAAWRVLMFYEDVDAEPPALARIGLPVPLHTLGRMARVGDVVRCVYSSGYLEKRITHFEPGRRLGFDVIEQHGIEDRSAELLRGSFAFEALPGGRTLVSLETVYRPLLGARPVWRPFEISLAQVLHNHVLDGMVSGARKSSVVLARSL